MSQQSIDLILLTEAYNVTRDAEKKISEIHVYTQPPHKTQQQLIELNELIHKIQSMLYGYKI